MITGLFMIPTSYTSPTRRVPLDYRAELRAIDKRTRFYRNFNQWETSAWIFCNAAERFGLRVIREGGELVRALAPDAKSAREFLDYMQRYDFGKERI